MYCQSNIKTGDFLILDNAEVRGTETLLNIRTPSNISIKFQPKYSLEFNPTEHVHQLVKSLIRNGHLPDGDFKEKISDGHEQVDVKSFYKKSIFLLAPIL
ncbi:hypothetical protein ACTA71_012079 [Dictyostelium dimigraforme]